MNKCPTCDKPIDPNIEGPGALSRVDNKTYVCSSCGSLEAWLDMFCPHNGWVMAMEYHWGHKKATAAYRTQVLNERSQKTN